MGEFSEQIIHEANRLAIEDPRRNLGIALGDLIGTESPTRDTMLDVLASRQQFTPEHLPPLLFSSLQYLALKDHADISGFATMNPEQWKKYIEGTVNTHRLDLTKLLKERNVQSFILRRYFPAKLLARVAYGDSTVSMLDIGSSLNLGLAAVAGDNSGEMFNGIELNGVPKNLYSGRVNLASGIGVDLFEPDKEWVKACIWPGHEDERDTIERASASLRDRTPQLSFRKLDALKMGEVPDLQDRFDIAVASGMIYQLQPDLKDKFLDAVRKVTKRKGFLLVNDYPPDVNAKDSFTYSTEVFPIVDGSIQTPLKILKAESPFYRKIKLGADFQQFVDSHTKKAL
ncbi:hypothetical protein A2715_05560 [Candidatus Woesebacteria bacterium RIFCSPHIGHO2_01_FULL_39_32]|uniref:Uncharacterized protein n=1 Tax=Candidatus Woesebacteria bacterium RIFCSPLOWO2_01_FULL_39_25 TaxID=1802521 RepID=A0A1F8BP12_9BACT|nr:MAG: hypothetical protein A2124_04005 [Candidatus Woesebacteria bacterium GWB1_37_5]OGM25487.1 MAG: hypothetical protein A2715_05560 [Candidatus Woesebacteria bacterium RIFCSPHIGHO2_01_FULL_39_32]OGM38740.1 MAG: hypothetical protein A3F01_06200 [Candidatus Woesebacteria bacterium RIFCSPHIGHO2_12_FULL_38_11]OGM65018.1 MAG: hypothetical protein A2893_05170 [Candidatus Woesebacteria bacterium RIFCSPLOWO2_01_FULL_39_25]